MSIRTLALTALLFSPACVHADGFEDWAKTFTPKAVAAGVPAAVVDTALAGLTPDPTVVRLDRAQPESFRGVGSYVQSTVTDVRVAKGVELLRQNAALLDRLERLTGVTGTIPVAVWGIETNFGSNTGSFDLVRSLATLAYDGRRRDFAERELIAALKMIANGTPREQLKGSWAGAFGQTQFMPTSAAAHAQDGDGDGIKDLFNPADALASSAAYLQGYKWKRGEPWVAEARLPGGFALAQANGPVKPLRDWVAMGLTRADGHGWPAEWLGLNTAIEMPMGHAGPMFITFDNFSVIKRYNASTSYALAVGWLANRISGQSGITAAWPEVNLSRADVEALQARLKVLGFSAETADGRFGPKTRDAIQKFQTANALPADGWPDTYTRAKLLGLDNTVPVMASAPAPAPQPLVKPKRRWWDVFKKPEAASTPAVEAKASPKVPSPH